MDTKKFRVSSLPRPLLVLRAVTRWVLSRKEQHRAEGPSGTQSAPHIAAASSCANLHVTNAPWGLVELPMLELSTPLPPRLMHFAGCSFPRSFRSSRSRRCCPTRTTRRTTGSGPSSTWTPLTCASRPWRPLRRRGKSMPTVWMSMSEVLVSWTPFITCALLVSSSKILPHPCNEQPQTALPVPISSIELLPGVLHRVVAVVCDLQIDPVTFCFP